MDFAPPIMNTTPAPSTQVPQAPAAPTAPGAPPVPEAPTPPTADGLVQSAGGDTGDDAFFDGQLADYKAANRELQTQNFAFKKLEGVIGLENRISQAKIG